MKRVAILSTILTCSIFADSPETEILTPPTTITLSPAIQGPHHFQVGLDIFRQYSRGEQNYFFDGCDHHVKWKTESRFVGPRVGYEYLKPGTYYFGLEGTIADSSTKQTVTYKPLMLNGAQEKTFTQKQITSVFGNLEGRIGHTYQWNSFSLISYGGLGWNYEQFDTATDRSVNWFYIVGGARMNQRVAKQFDLGLNTNITYAFPPHCHKIKEKHANEGFWGYEIGVPMTWYAGKNKILSVKLEPYYQVLDAKTHFYNLGSRLEFGFRF